MIDGAPFYIRIEIPPFGQLFVDVDTAEAVHSVAPFSNQMNRYEAMAIRGMLPRAVADESKRACARTILGKLWAHRRN